MTVPSHDEVGTGTPLVLLHAFPLSSAMWRHQRASLGEHAHLITCDQRGFGGTPLGEAEPSLAVVADDVAELLDHLDVPAAVLCGLSMGGYVAMEFARRHPTRVRGLILADTKASADTAEQRAGRLAMAETVEREGTTDVLRTQLLPKLTGSTTRARRPEVMAEVAGWVAEAAPAAVAWAQRAMAARGESFDVLAGLAVPMLVVVGDEDVMAPVAEAHRMTQAAADADLVLVPGAGHLSHVEDAAAFDAAVLEFLSRLP